MFSILGNCTRHLQCCTARRHVMLVPLVAFSLAFLSHTAWCAEAVPRAVSPKLLESAAVCQLRCGHAGGTPEGIIFRHTTLDESLVERCPEINEAESIELFYCTIGTRFLRKLRTATKLVALSLYVTNDSDLDGLEELDQLRDLTVWGNAITDAGLSHLSRLSRLKKLYIDQCKLTDATLARIASLDQLEELSVCNTAVTAPDWTDSGILATSDGCASLTRLMTTAWRESSGLLNLKSLT